MQAAPTPRIRTHPRARQTYQAIHADTPQHSGDIAAHLIIVLVAAVLIVLLDGSSNVRLGSRGRRLVLSPQRTCRFHAVCLPCT